MSNRTIRRQPHGINVEQITVTISRDEMTRLRREALAKRITVSRHVVDLVRLAWSVQGALAPIAQPESEAVAD